MSVVDWIGVVLLAPLLLALVILIVYLVIGMIGSIPRRRRIAKQPPPDSTGDTKPSRSPRRAPGD